MSEVETAQSPESVSRHVMRGRCDP